jgi:hypothetical protein
MKFIVYLIFLNGVLLGDPWGTSHPYGTANRTFFGPEKRSDSSPEDIKRLKEKKESEERLKIESSRRLDIQNESQNLNQQTKNKESSEYKKDYATTKY